MAATRRTKKDAARTLRLERGEGPSSTFWEVSRAGGTITARFGRRGSAGRTIVKDLGDAGAAERALEKMIEAKRKEGYAEPAPRPVVGASSKKGVCVRNEELESMIEAAPDDPEGYLVYADWLQQRGDPRGELITVQHGRANDPSSSALERAEATLFAMYEAELLGPLVKYTHVRTMYRSYRGLAWRYGFIRAARLRRISETKLSDVVRTLLQHPSGRFLERLVLGRPSYGNAEETDLDAVYDVLSKHAPATLGWLLVGDGLAPVGSLAALWPAMPRLRTLVLAGAVTALGSPRADALEELRIEHAEPGVLAAVANARWPSLARLDLTLGTMESWSNRALAPLLRREVAPSLAHLRVRRWLENERAALIPHDALAVDTATIAAERGLTRLDLDVPFGEQGARLLLARAPALRAVGTIAIPEGAIASPALRAAISGALANVRWVEPPVEEPAADLEALDAS